MNRQNTSKTNLILRQAPRGAVLTTDWLKNHGISIKLAWWYVQAGWLEHLASGAYVVPEDKITWSGVLSSLQQQNHLPVHLGGKTALQLLGKGHYLAPELSEGLQLFAPAGTQLPRWVHKSIFGKTFCLYANALFSNENALHGIIIRSYENIEVHISAPERAALELCSLVPNSVTFQEACLLMEQLTKLRPDVVQSLLESCQSFKTKRLFLYLSDYHNHAWTNDLDLNRIDLGKGKQVIAGGGKYHTKYKISVPKLEEN